MRQKTLQYIRAYKWSNIFAMIRNSRQAPQSCHADCRDKLVVISGATSGIGRVTALKFASKGARLLCINRNPEKSARLKEEIVSKFGTVCDYLIADLSRLEDIYRVAEELSRLQSSIDVLIHNAGVYLTKRELCSDGLEKVFVVHYLSSFIINYLLVDKLKAQEKARIIMVGSEGHRFAAWGLRLDDLNWEQRRYSGLGSYGSAKLAQLLSMLCFADLFDKTGTSIITMHPGAVKTETGQDNGPLYRWLKRHCLDKLLTTAEISAEALYYLGASPEAEGVNGKFFHLTSPEEPAPPALDKAAARKLWEQTLRISGLQTKTGLHDPLGDIAGNRDEGSYDAIVVGGGIAGLTATVYLAKAGLKVALLEKNKEPGGLVNSLWHNGFRFDAGVRALEDAGIILPMLRDLGITLETVKSPVSIGIEADILNIENYESLGKYQELLSKLYPGSEADIAALIKSIRKIMKHMDVLYGIQNPLFMDLKRDRRYVLHKLLPWLPRFVFTIAKINRMGYPVEQFLKSTVSNPSLRDIISQHFFKNTPAFFALSYFSLYLDYFYPKGGVGKISQALENKILELGAEIKTEVQVCEIQPGTHSVLTASGTRYRYKNLIWAADLKNFYRITQPHNLPPEAKLRFETMKAKMLRHKGAESVFSLFLEVNEPPESFGSIAHGHFFYTPSRLGLGETNRKELQELLRSFDDVGKEQVISWLDRFISLNTFEISIPALKDRDASPSGQTGLIISFLADYELFAKVKNAGWDTEFITEIENRVLELLTRTIYPCIKDKVSARFSFSPLSLEHRVGSSEGAIVGWAFQADMLVVNQIQLAARSVHTPLPSIYQAGQWAYSPAGVPMSILSAKLAVDKILKKHQRQEG